MKAVIGTIGWGLIVAGGICAVTVLVTLWRRYQRERWPTVPAALEYARIVRRERTSIRLDTSNPSSAPWTPKRMVWDADVAYTYTLGDRTYRATTLAYGFVGETIVSPEQTASSWLETCIARLQGPLALAAHYDPGSPSTSFLVQRPIGSSVRPVAFVAVPLVVGLVLVLAAGRMLPAG